MRDEEGLQKSTADAETSEARELEALKQRLATLDEAFQEFLFAASHDLRGPLNQVRVLTRLLNKQHKDALNDDGQALCGYIDTAAKRAADVFESLHSYAHVSEPPSFENVDSEAVVKAAVYSLEGAVEQSQAEIVYVSLPPLQADPRKLMRLFEELLGNALKFRALEPLRIVVSSHTEGGTVIFSVRDNGVGIPQDKAELIFKPFTRLHGHEFPGTGMGLAVCRRIVELHHGRIWVESTPGGGSDFRFTLSLSENASSDSPR